MRIRDVSSYVCSSDLRFDSLRRQLLAYFQGRKLYVQDVYAGADPEYLLSVRVITDSPWHSLFAQNMFIRPLDAEMSDFVPDVTILHAQIGRASCRERVCQ